MMGIVHLRSPTSISGHALFGKNLVRLVFLDETGMSKTADDPHLGIVGVIVNADMQYRDIDLYLRNIVADIWPEYAGERFVFHAKDIWHGSREFDRRKWTRNQRMSLMRRLAAIPGRFHLPITYGFVDKASLFEEYSQIDGRTIGSNILAAYLEALHLTLRSVEYWMEHHSDNETAMLIIENASKIKNVIRMLHGGYSSAAEGFDSIAFTSRHIIDAPSVQEKSDSIMLQIADHCAFILKRVLAGKSDVDELYKLIAPQIVHGRDNRTGKLVAVPIRHVSFVSRDGRSS